MKRYAAFFTLGLLAGMMTMHSFQGRELEKLYWEKENLKVELYEKKEQIKKIESQQETLLPPTVRKIELEITLEDGGFVEPELKLQVYDLIKGLLGEEVLALPYPLIFNILDNRIVEVGDKRYRLNVEAVILGETLVYYLKASKTTDEELT
ncbi:MAG TPA: hypothetical protein GX004_10230 [Firmicutes bacterium]|nr:hypothetical protein [Bacillota bacterium]